MEKKKNEDFIFHRLDKECEPGSTPIPHWLHLQKRDFELLGFIVECIAISFQKMRDSEGESNWEFDSKEYLGSNIGDGRSCTANYLNKLLLKAIQEQFFDYAIREEKGTKIITKLNAELIFNELLNKEIKHDRNS